MMSGGVGARDARRAPPSLSTRFRPPSNPHPQQATVQGAARVPDLKRARRERDKAYAELGQRLERAGTMRKVLDRMSVEKAVMTVGD